MVNLSACPQVTAPELRNLFGSCSIRWSYKIFVERFSLYFS